MAPLYFPYPKCFKMCFLPQQKGLTALPVNGAWLRVLETVSVHVTTGIGSLLTEKHHHNVNFVCSHCCDSKWVVGRELNLLVKRF